MTNLNIAQVKQKHGIIERENYNKPKLPERKQPGCPEEKVKALEDAMRHFQMIYKPKKSMLTKHSHSTIVCLVE